MSDEPRSLISPQTHKALVHLLWIYGDAEVRPDDFIDGASHHELTTRDAEKMANAVLEVLNLVTAPMCDCGWGGQHDPENVRCSVNGYRFNPETCEYEFDTELKKDATL